MRLGTIFFTVLICFAYNTYAQDDVMVDLSVLEGLNTSYIAPHKPMFPVLPRKDKIISDKSETKSSSIKKKLPIKPKNSAVSVKSENNVKKEKKPDTSSSNKIVEVRPEENIVVVDVEPAAPNEYMPKSQELESKANKKTEDKLQQDQQLRNVKLADSSDTTKKIEASVAALEASFSKGTDEEAETSEFHPKLLVEDIPAKELEVNNSIKFASGVDTLSSEQMSQINSIIGGFKDIEHNKIAIYSYNQDDGVDSFKKKRISLNRAIEVRSYLIKQGYKNFSIKVININSGSDKIDTVEIEEL